MWDLPRPGLEPVSPALAGGFPTTAPPGKPRHIFKVSCVFIFLLLSFKSLLFILDNSPLSWVFFCKHLFPACGLSSHSHNIVFCRAVFHINNFFWQWLSCIIFLRSHFLGKGLRGRCLCVGGFLGSILRSNTCEK